MSELSVDAIEAMLSHMNEDHGDAVDAYAHHFGGVVTFERARLTSMDARGIVVTVTSDRGTTTIPIPFDHELVDAEDGRNTLIAMYQQAAASKS